MRAKQMHIDLISQLCATYSAAILTWTKSNVSLIIRLNRLKYANSDMFTLKASSVEHNVDEAS